MIFTHSEKGRSTKSLGDAGEVGEVGEARGRRGNVSRQDCASAMEETASISLRYSTGGVAYLQTRTTSWKMETEREQ